MGFHPNAGQVYDENGYRKYLDSRERERFLAAADTLCSAQRAFCYVLAFTGARVSEALELGPHRIDADNLALRFRTLKRRKASFRVIPVPETIVTMLHALPTGDGNLFWPFHRTTAWRLICETMARAQITGPMATCKGLRHAFGIRAATCNLPGPLVQRFMGHASLTTTAIYLDAVGTEEREFARRMW